MRGGILAVWVVVFLCLGKVMFSQSNRFPLRDLGTEDGIANSDVYSILQDSSGFVWLGTQSGLQRYDGHNWMLYNSFSQPALSSNEINKIVQHSAHTFWIATGNGLNYLDLIADSVQVFLPDPDDPHSISDHRVHDIHLLPDGRLLVGTDNGSLEIYEQGKGFELIHRHRTDFLQKVYGSNYYFNWVEIMAVDTAGHIWIREFYGDVHEFAPNRDEGAPFLPVDSRIRTPEMVHTDWEGGVWAAIDDTLCRMVPGSRKFVTVHPLPSQEKPSRRYLRRDHRSYLWIIDDNNLHRYDIKTGELEALQPEFLPSWSLVRGRTWMEDQQGQIWISHGRMVATFRPAQSPFQLSSLPSANPEGAVARLPNVNAYPVTDDEFRLHNMYADGKCLRTSVRLPSHHSDYIYGEEHLWLATGHGGLAKVHLQSGKVRSFSISGVQTMHHTLERDGDRLYIGLGAGVASFDVQTQRFERYEIPPIVKVARVQGIAIDEAGTIWAASSKGLLHIDPQNHSGHAYNLQTRAKGLKSMYMLDICRTEDGLIWIASKAGGLIRFDPRREEFHHYTTKDGLCHNSVRSVIPYGNGIWLGTDHGLSYFDPKMEQFTNFPGLENQPFPPFVVGRKKVIGNKIWMETLGGTVHFSPDAVLNPRKPYSNEKVMISAFSCSDASSAQPRDLYREWLEEKSVVLSPGDRDFDIRFALNNYENPVAHQFSYQFSDWGERWLDLGPQSRLRLRELPPGDYEVRIRGRSSGQEWATPAVIHVRKAQVFYRRPLVIATMVIALLVVFALILWQRARRSRRTQRALEKRVAERTTTVREQKREIEDQHQKLQALDQLKSQFFANISHELRTPLTLLTGHIRRTLAGDYGEIPDGIAQRLNISERNGNHLLELTDEIMDLSRLEAGQLQLVESSVLLPAFLQTQVVMFQSLAEKKGLALKAEIDLEKDLAVMIDVAKYTKIIRNLLSNALKFTGSGGSVTLYACKTERQQIKLRVRDTGRGIHPDDLPRVFDRFFQTSRKNAATEGGTGIGLALAAEYAELAGGRLTASSEWGKGSEFTFIFPLRLAVLPPEKKEDTTEEVAMPPANEGDAPIPTRDSVVLIVDDHDDMRDFIREIIQPHFRTLSATDGKDALQVMSRERVDLVLTDMMMPEMDGFQLLARIRSTAALRDRPVIMLTARAGIGDKVNAFTTGVDDYLVKPFHPEELLARITALLSNRVGRLQWLKEADEPRSSARETFVKAAQAMVTNEITNPDFSVTDLADALNISERQVYRELKANTGLTPLQFMREVRLQEARRLLEHRSYRTVAETMHAVGYRKKDHFAKVFRKRFGKLPGEYL